MDINGSFEGKYGKYNMSSENYRITLLTIVLIFWAWSGIGLHDTRLTWVLETVPIMIALPIMHCINTFSETR